MGDHLLAVLREALSNVARDALAEHAAIEVWADAHEVRLTVAVTGSMVAWASSGNHSRRDRVRRASERRAGVAGGRVIVLHGPSRAAARRASMSALDSSRFGSSQSTTSASRPSFAAHV